MAILVDKNTRLLVQGITGREGLYHSQQMLAYGTTLVAGVTPGKGGSVVLDSVPVYHTVHRAVEETGATASVIFVPPRFAAEAMLEAADAGIQLIVCITEGIPVLDVMRVRSILDAKGITLIGPNCPGLLTPGQAKVGIIPGNTTFPGSIGVVSRSGTLTYEVLFALKQAGLGVSTCVGIGGDPIHGLGFVDIVERFQSDPQTEAIVLIGEIGGSDEETAAAYIHQHVTKPVIGFIAGLTAPAGKRMGHAGAIIERGAGTAQEKIEALRAAGIAIAHQPEEIPALIDEALKPQ